MYKRLVILFSLMLLLSGGLMTRLLLLTAESGYVAAAGSQKLYRLEVCRTRGTIYDCKLRSLAGGFAQYRACIAPSYSTLMHLRRVMTDEQYYAIESRLRSPYPFVLPVEDGSIDGAGVEVLRAKTRYGHATCAPHTVGYLGADGHGVYGIEKAYDSFLSAQDGELSVSYTVSANGRSLEGTSPYIFDSTAYSDAGVVLTIDIDIQQRVEEAVKARLDRGAAVVMELPGGQLRACVSVPDFDPGDVAAVLDAEHSPLVDRTISPFDTGSVFKLVTAAAALEAGISPDRKYLCEGSIQAGGNTFHCSSHAVHGEEDMSGALAQSCNTYFIDLASEVGGSRLLNMARSFGFGSSLRLADNLYTDAGCLPSADTLSRPAGLANFAFGQGELLATPVHIAKLIGTIANGGVSVEPTLYEGRVDMRGHYIDTAESAEGQRVISEATAAFLREAMRAAVLSGTAKKGASPYIASAAKTGTAQTGIKEDGHYILEAWYAGYFPAGSPRYVCVVLAENGESGGGTAGPVFADIAEALYRFV